MSNNPGQEIQEIEGSFADLGLDQPGQVEIPTRGVPIGTHKGFVRRAAFVAAKTAGRKNVFLEFEVREAGSRVNGMRISEQKPANPDDKPIVKGFLSERLTQLGVPVAEQPRLNLKTLEGRPVYFTVGPQKDNPQYTQIVRVQLDNDADYTGEVPAGNAAPQQNQQAVSADSLGY